MYKSLKNEQEKVAVAEVIDEGFTLFFKLNTRTNTAT